MIGFNTNVFETNILNLRAVVVIVTGRLVDVLRETLNQRRLTIRNTKLEVLEKTYELQLELESFWVLERYVTEECSFIRRSVKSDVIKERYRQTVDEKMQIDLYQKRYDETLLNKVNQIERLLRQRAFTSAMCLAKTTLKEEFQRIEKQQKLNEELLITLGLITSVLLNGHMNGLRMMTENRFVWLV